jgi:hypothetical protein|eukprot:CAMPEP_0174342784 /NCGR_PEP_ID=MMETSP0810-20121108/26426_1 /TAXON_ID=73025 ORGANISM="Eutreptiella gymnastica-like, Strain CCMP1594" /NCGR_SAMPLE_ID=MMETSP0810 /ASSEMBLY_ACC=CAM_ASM_000659 /LENGTH=86 /DNA_ID=CAMNT_0015465103 /DNA_START=342 /DNA_END=602 /DNA_ORIENTATION=+
MTWCYNLKTLNAMPHAHCEHVNNVEHNVSNRQRLTGRVAKTVLGGHPPTGVHSQDGAISNAQTDGKSKYSPPLALPPLSAFLGVCG